MAIRGSCLCGDVAWEAEGPLEFMSHCHCARCRKAHGAAFATGMMTPPDAFRLVRGHDRIVRYESTPGIGRPFCGRCGSVVASGDAAQGLVPVPAGPCDDDPGVRPLAQIFVASKAPWCEITGPEPCFDAYPPSFDAPVFPDLVRAGDATDGPRGSCLCGGVAYVLRGPARGAWNCHCSRCRKARGAAFASNLLTGADGVRFTQGEALLVEMPRVAAEYGVAGVPMGSLDDDPGIRPQFHVFVGSKAPWWEIRDALPRFVEGRSRTERKGDT